MGTVKTPSIAFMAISQKTFHTANLVSAYIAIICSWAYAETFRYDFGTVYIKI